MDTGTWIALGASVISLTTLILSGLSLRHKSDIDYVASLEKRLDLAEESLERCRKAENELRGVVEGLEKRNAMLMKIAFDRQEGKT